MFKKIMVFYIVCAITGFALGYSPPPDKLPSLTPDAAAFFLISPPGDSLPFTGTSPQEEESGCQGSWSTAWSVTLTANGNSWGGPQLNARQVIFSTDTSASGAFVRFTVYANTTQDLYLDAMTIGVRSGTSDDFTSTPTVVTFNSGQTTLHISAGQSAVSDEIEYAFDTGTSYLIAMWHDTNHNYVRYGNEASDVMYYDYGSGKTDQTQTLNVSYSNTGITQTVRKIEVCSNP